jgi:DNA repair protein RecN (Recombination protein N)
MSENGTKEMEFLQFQLTELQGAELRLGEQESLESDLTRMTNSEDIKRSYGTAYNLLSENDMSIIGQLQELARSMNATRRLSPQLGELSERMDAIIIDVQELAKDLERVAEQTEYDPQRIGELQERLNVIYKLQKKHTVSDTAALLEIQEKLEQQTAGFTDLGGEIERLQATIDTQEKQLRKKAAHMSERRRSVTADFEQRVQSMLTQLSMPHARLKVDIEETSHLTSTGLDDVRFLFATNVGSKFLPIKDVASGGELSRLTLCTKSLVADAIPLPTLIFDEIDTGISGDVSLKMGLILKELSDRHQVVSITHTPQIAARADRHYFVFKKVADNRTITNVRLLSPDERVRSLAVMLSGNPPSESALATAAELIAG